MDRSEKKDRSKKRGAGLAAAVIIFLMLLWDGLMTVALVSEHMPLPLFLWMTVPATVVIVGIAIALHERIKEIEGGEENAAADY